MKKFFILILFFAVLAGGILFFGKDIFDPYFERLKAFFQADFLEIKNKIPSVIETIKKEVFAPPPLRVSGEKEIAETVLDSQGVIEWTNIQRQRYGLASLKENSKLNAMAQFKVEDMFQYQYFAHQSISGRGAGDLADEFGYKFILIGENLAMGIFQDNKSLVDAWMASSDHRENILKANYKEIGVAVKRGVFEGKIVWLAVQHFGTSVEDCSQPSELVEILIEEKQQEILIIKELLLKLEIELRAIKPKRGTVYQEKLNEYNNLVEKHNNLLSEINMLVNQYNKQIQQFNRCVFEISDSS